MDNLTLERIGLLHPAVRQDALSAYTHVNNNLLGREVRLRFSHTLRTHAEQDALYALGRTKLTDVNGRQLQVVTNAKAGESIHNYGMAFDIVLLNDATGDGTFTTASWDTRKDFDKDGTADWTEITRHFKSKGWSWGGDWKKFPDYPHFEKTFGHNWKSLKQRYDAGKTFTETINGKIYKWVQL